MSASWPPEVDIMDVLTPWLREQRWFPGTQGERIVLRANVDYSSLSAPLDWDGVTPLDPVWVSLIEVGNALVQVPLVYTDTLPPDVSTIISQVEGAWLVDGPAHPAFARAWLRLSAALNQLGEVVDTPSDELLHTLLEATAHQRVLTGEQSNTSVVIGSGDRVAVLKIFRIVQAGDHPELEIPLALSRQGWRHVPLTLAYVSIPLPGERTSTCLGVMTGWIEGATDGFTYFGEHARQGEESFHEARNLGVVTAQLHHELYLAFGAPVRLDPADLAERVRVNIDAAAAEVPELDSEFVKKLEDALLPLANVGELPALIRIHGDYHLGQTMHSEAGWYVLDFEGEPLRPLSQRRSPDLALRDVAGMLRSFDYVGTNAEVDREWVERAQRAFIDGYTDGHGFDETETLLLRVLQLEKASYEVIYEHRLRPEWLDIPMAALRRLVDEN